MITIPLSRGHFAKIDDEDAALSEFKWYSQRAGPGIFYAARRPWLVGEKCPLLLMHRAILGVSARRISVDHINGDTLDNRRENLRAVSQSENLRNRAGAQSNNHSTGVLGVYKKQNGAPKPYFAMVKTNQKSIHLGSYATLGEACEARLAGERRMWGIQPRRASAHLP